MENLGTYETKAEEKAYRAGYRRAKRGELFEFDSDNPYAYDGNKALATAFADGVYEWQVYGVMR